MRCKLTVDKCSNYIDHLRTVIPIIIERRGENFSQIGVILISLVGP
jgi:hypothetical protein